MEVSRSSARQRYIFGGYEILDTIGNGGMGVVYRAMDLTLGREVALKILHDDLRSQPQIVARFEREAQAFAKLDHPNIVPIYSVGCAEAIPYIAMKYVEGEPLSDLLANRGPLPWPETLDIGLQVADALACAHDAQIIHRDVKPGNIIVDKEGKVFITDFGIAKVLGAASQLTVDGSRLGTPQYMCPERCRNLEIGPASDIYSLGVVLFQCISGRLPFEAASPVELIQKIAVEQPARLSRFVPEIPEAVDRLIAYMIERNPANRPKDARTLFAAIERVLQGKPLDERADEMTKAIAAFRRTLPASRRVAQPVHRESTTETGERAGWMARLRKRWFDLPRTIRLGAAAMALIALASALAVPIVRVLPGRPVYDYVRSSNYGIERWTRFPATAEFREETPSVRLAQLSLPDFEVSRIRWVDGAAFGIVQLDGVPDTVRTGQRALFGVDPQSERVSVIIPPTPTDPAHPFEILTGGITPNGVPGCVVSTASQTVFLPHPSLDSPVGMLSQAACAAATWPGSPRVALAYPVGGTADRYVLATVSFASPGVPVGVTPAGPRISSVVYSPDGMRLAYVREISDAEREVWIATIGASPGSGVRLASGNLRLGSAPFHPDSRSLVISRDDGTGVKVIEILNAQDGRPIAELGPGTCAIWHPGGDYILAVAADHAGRAQLWTIRPSAPLERTQLTYLSAGILPQVAVSDDGRYALAAEPGSSTAVLARL